MNLEPNRHRSLLTKALVGAAAVTVVGTMTLVIVAAASSSSSSRSVRMAGAGAPAAMTPTGAQLQDDLSQAQAGAESTAAGTAGAIIATVADGLKGLAGSVTAGRDDPTTTSTTAVKSTTSTTATGSTTSTTSTTKDDSDNDESEHGSAVGTVAAVTGSGFTVTVAGSTTPKVVTTSASTVFILTAPGTVADAAVGTGVLALGTRDSTGALAATKLAVLPAVQLPGGGGSEKGAAKAGAASPRDESEKSSGHVFGKVTANTGGTLTVDTPSGPQTVTTSMSTTVTTTAKATLAAVTVGASVQVMGMVAADGSLSAQLVHIGPLPLDMGGDDHEGLGAGLDKEVGSMPDSPTTPTPTPGAGHDG